MASSQLPKKRRKKIIEEQSPKNLNILKDNSSDDDIPLSQLTVKLKTAPQPITPVKIEKGPDTSVGLSQSSKKRKKFNEQPLTVPYDSNPSPKNKKSRHYSTFATMTTVAAIYNVQARILHVWHVRPYSNQPFVIMFTARDEQGILREGLVPQDLASTYKDSLKECTSCKIIHVVLADSDTQTKLINCPYRLLFTNKTKIQELQDSIPIEPLSELLQLKQIPDLLTDRSLLKGFIAVVTDIRPPVLRITKNGPVRFVELFVTDATIWPRCAIITIWEDIYNNYMDILVSDFREQFVIVGIGLRATVYKAKPRSTDGASMEGSLPHPTSTRFLSYEELKEATNNFEAASVLGEGGFGRVFKGVLSDGTAVAIKKLTTGGHQGDKEFLVEVEMLSRLHHRNLVRLVGYYSSRDSSQNLLCYELVPNGSLESWLHGPLGANCPLDWDTRMKIALDAARGLAYLHEDSQPCVIHRDFKASNILLENNFHAKVSDFGLAKQAPEGRANYLSTRVMGTFGYVAPEYAMTGHLLVKSDVYSYGVVLLELLTGRRPVDMSQPSGQENLVTWARPILRDKDRLEELADPRLAGKYPKEDFVRVCTIAAACVAPEASQRPTMGEVVQSLKMVQRLAEYQDTMPNPSARPNIRQSSTTYESDGTSSMFSSGPFSGLSLFDNDNISRTAVFSEDLHEGR